jgi:hypothetical protein
VTPIGLDLTHQPMHARLSGFWADEQLGKSKG